MNWSCACVGRRSATTSTVVAVAATTPGVAVVTVGTGAPTTPPPGETTSSPPVTSSRRRRLRHDDDVIVDDVGLVQAALIVCTVAVTLALSAVIIGVIVRLRRRDDDDDDDDDRRRDVTSGHVTAAGSRVSVAEEALADGCRSERASSLSRGGRTADCQRKQGKDVTCSLQQGTGGRAAVCARDKVDRLASRECLFTNGGGARLTDEQWRLYTWEDT